MHSRLGSDFQGAHELTIDEHHAGQRIDNFLITRLKGLPRTRIYRILRRGEVRVNKGRIRQHYRLKPGDVVRIPPLVLEPRARPETPASSLLELMEERVVYEDRGLIALDKPSGIAVHGGSGRSYGIIEAMRAARPGDRALELVHRLDRDTSGCLLLAKRRAVLKALHDAFRRGQVDKRYLVLVKGRWRGGPRSASASLRKNQSRSGERVVKVDSAGKLAETRFVPLAVGPEASLLEARPVTGRTHQIRVHAATLGHPVAGDPKYGERDFNRQLRKHGLRRLFLHAASLRLENPTTKTTLQMEAPVPEDLQAALACLGLDYTP
jgi:23S rRNA pseudouridine955/2504/2580 synthase